MIGNCKFPIFVFYLFLIAVYLYIEAGLLRNPCTQLAGAFVKLHIWGSSLGQLRSGMARLTWWWRACASVAVVLCAIPKPASVPLSSSPYDILKIPKRATLSEVRNAYRARARETHPDKHPGNEEKMHAAFLEVVAAFELLSDASERAIFDRTGRASGGGRAAPRPREPARPSGARSLTPEQERAAARAINIRSRKHLEDTALGEDGRVDRHFVLALYDEGACEAYLSYETRFPYPFADKLDAHGIWWEDVLQTARITPCLHVPTFWSKTYR